MSGPDGTGWREAMENELQNLEKFGVFKRVKLKPGMKILRGNWVTETKLNPVTLKETRKKARLTVGGDKQQSDPISYSPVTSMEGIRLILGLAARNNWRLSTFDVKKHHMAWISTMTKYWHY